jgi:O-antigen/teichoic acid export membrane protein
MTVSDSHSDSRRILRSTTLVGSVTLVTLVIGLMRTKAIALVLGTEGIGLVGLFGSIMTMGTSIIGFGIYSSGVRQIAATADDDAAARVSMRALWTLSFLLAVAGGILFWLLRYPITIYTTGSDRYVSQVGWIALGIAMSILSGAFIASIQGYRRMGDFARAQLYGNVIGAIAGVASVIIFGETAVIAVVLIPPATACLFGYIYARRLPNRPSFGLSPNLLPIWKSLMHVGIAVTVSAMMGSATQIVARTIVVRMMGLNEAGLFQAAWTISAVNIGLLLAAMSADYYPRLSGVSHDPSLMAEEVNRQVHVALLLAGPLLIGVTAMAPVALWLLYSREFQGAAELLQWLTAADILRLTGWALGYVMLARQATFSYIAIEASFGLVFIPAMLVLAPLVGLPAAGAAYFIGYLACLAASMLLARRVHGIHVSRANVIWTGSLTLFLLSMIALYQFNVVVAAVIGLLTALGLAIRSLSEISKMGVSIPMVSAAVTRGKAWLQRG